MENKDSIPPCKKQKIENCVDNIQNYVGYSKEASGTVQLRNNNNKEKCEKR